MVKQTEQSYQTSMYVIKRDGRHEPVSFDKITKRIQSLTFDLDTNFIDPTLIAQQVCASVISGIKTSELDVISANVASSYISKHPDYSLLAARILISNLHKSTPDKFSECVNRMYHYVNPKTGEHNPKITDELYKLVKENASVIDAMINNDRDFINYDYFGFKSLEKSYLTRINGEIIERPQYMLMRVALGIHGDSNDFKDAKETYEMMSTKAGTQATPSLFHIGTPMGQACSCFLQYTEDSIEGIVEKTMGQASKLMKGAGGIGIHFNDVRASGSPIKSSNDGTSQGIVPWLRMYNQLAKAVNQSGRRPGSIAIYLEPWHADIEDFLKLRLSSGDEDSRARELFLAVWLNDEFMRRVEADEMWSLMCPHECKGLTDAYGEAFVKLYKSYEAQGKYRKQVPAKFIMELMIRSMTETGTPYVLNKDTANLYNNQANFGTLKGSNLCAEILIYTDAKQVGTCNLASICLPKFITTEPNKETGHYYNFHQLHNIARVLTRNLNKIIDINHYLVPESEYSNKQGRPIAIGVQGLADTFALLRMPFTSPEAKELNKLIFQTIYHGFLTETIELAKRDGPYPMFWGSPASQGILQPDMWNIDLHNNALWDDWNQLRQDLKTYGMRNSLGVSLMPTASTSNIMGNVECFEPIKSNIFMRKVLSGEHTIVNKYLIRDLIKLNLWNDDIKDKIILENGSVQNIPEIPYEIRQLYKTAYELKQKDLIDMDADRAPYICHTQSSNRFVPPDNVQKRIYNILMYAWSRRLKTLSYYIRQMPVRGNVKFSISAEKQIRPQIVVEDEAYPVCSKDNPNCESCSG